MNEHDGFTVDVEDGIAEVVLDDPRSRNSLSLATIDGLIAAFEALGRRTDADVIVLGHEGPAFSAGHDLREMSDRDLPFYQELFDRCSVLMQSLHYLPQPVIARVDGVATAAGCQLVASCDLVVATDRSSFATPGVRIGLFCSTPMVALSRSVGRKRALQMLLTGEPVSAVTAADWGLVNRAVPDDQLDAAVADLIGRATRGSALSKSLGKRSFYAQVGLDQPDAYEVAIDAMASAAMIPDAQEGFTAFLEKRHPNFTQHP